MSVGGYLQWGLKLSAHLMVDLDKLITSGLCCLLQCTVLKDEREIDIKAGASRYTKNKEGQ